MHRHANNCHVVVMCLSRSGSVRGPCYSGTDQGRSTGLADTARCSTQEAENWESSQLHAESEDVIINHFPFILISLPAPTTHNTPTPTTEATGGATVRVWARERVEERVSSAQTKTWHHGRVGYDIHPSQLHTCFCFCRIQKVLTGSQEEVEVLVKNYQSTTQLASFLVILRRDYDALKASKAAIKKEKDKLSQEITYLKRKVCSQDPSLPIISSLILVSFDSRSRAKERSSSHLIPRFPC